MANETKEERKNLTTRIKAAQELRRADALRDLSNRRVAPWKKGYALVYMVATEDGRFFKLGHSANFGHRLSTLRTSQPENLYVRSLIVCKDVAEAKRIERELLIRCQKWRVGNRREWFRLTDYSRRVMEEIQVRCTHPEWVLYANRDMPKVQAERLRARRNEPLR